MLLGTEVVTGAFEGVAELGTEPEAEPEAEPEPLSVLVPSIEILSAKPFQSQK